MDKLLLDRFSGLLNVSLSLLNELKDMAEEEKKALIECDYEALDKILKCRELLLTKFQETIKELEETFPKFTDGEDKKITSLTELSKYIDEPYSSLFNAFPGKFNGLIKVIHEANIRNLIVLNHCKEMIYEFLCTLAQKVQPSETYSSIVKICKQEPPSFIASSF